MDDDLVRIEFRGILGTICVGRYFIVESFEAGVLHLRSAPPPSLVAAPVAEAEDAPETPKQRRK